MPAPGRISGCSLPMKPCLAGITRSATRTARYLAGTGRVTDASGKPRSRWFDVSKWQAFAARQVARELRLSHVWSWGWAQRDERSRDPDKTYAACVWLWARDPGLCDAPAILADHRAPEDWSSRATELAHGLPVAVSFWGTAGSEATLVEIGHGYEQARDRTTGPLPPPAFPGFV